MFLQTIKKYIALKKTIDFLKKTWYSDVIEKRICCDEKEEYLLEVFRERCQKGESDVMENREGRFGADFTRED